MIILWCILCNFIIMSSAIENSFLFDPKSEFVEYVKPIKENVMLYNDKQLKEFKEKHKKDKLIDMTNNLVLNDENIHNIFPTGKFPKSNLCKKKFIEEPNVRVLNIDKLQYFQKIHPEDNFIFLENPKQHDFSQSGSALSLVKTSTVVLGFP